MDQDFDLDDDLLMNKIASKTSENETKMNR